MALAPASLGIHDRVVATLEGRKPDRLPFIDRLELWHTALERSGSLPEEFRDLSLTEIHRAVGIGREKYLPPYSFRLRGVELTADLNGEVFYHETDPVFDRLPTMQDLVPSDMSGLTRFELATPVGKLRVQQELLEEASAWGEHPYLKEHPIKDEADYRTVQYILQRAEFVPRYERFRKWEERLGDVGFVVPYLHRIPFQQALIDYVGEIELFYTLNDNPKPVQKADGRAARADARRHRQPGRIPRGLRRVHR